MRLATTAAVMAAALVVVVATRSGAGDEAGKPKAMTLSACPVYGAEKKTSSRGALNEVKIDVPSATTPIALEFTDFPEMQRIADSRVKSGTEAKVSAKARASNLRGLTVGTRTVGEGDLVSLVGFIVGKASANAGESANCYLKGAANNDFEFSIAPSAKATPYEGIVGEMIPQDRPKDWTLARLHKLAADGRQVLIEGQLMFDTRHLPNPRKGTNHESPRFSTWEVHPVTKFLVCLNGSGCDPAKADQWQPLASISER